MSTSSSRRTRTDRIAALGLAPGRLGRMLEALFSGQVLGRLGLCLAAAAALWVIHRAWAPPFAFRLNYTPERDIQSRVKFEIPDAAATKVARERAGRDVVCVYSLHPQAIDVAPQALKDDLFKVVRRTSAEGMDEPLWQSFYPPADAGETAKGDPQKLFELFRDGLKDDQELTRFSTAVKRALAPLEAHGILSHLAEDHRQNSDRLEEIEVLPAEAPARRHVVKVDEIRIETVRNRLRSLLEAEFKTEKLPVEFAPPVYSWLIARLTKAANDPQAPILAYHEAETKTKSRTRQAEVPEKQIEFFQHEDLVQGGVPLTADGLAILRTEHERYVGAMPLLGWVVQSLSYFGMCLALYVLCGAYIRRRDPGLVGEVRRLGPLLVLLVLAASLYRLGSGDHWWVELVPIILLSMIASLVYGQELALLLTGAVALLSILSCGHGLDQFVLVTAAGAAAILLTGRVRSRTKLMYDGALTGCVAFGTTLGVEVLFGQPLQWPLLQIALWYGFCGVLSGLVMTGLLPFIERIFDVQTDISLLELGDAAHPLLQELVRRAPGTYNHSINVASIAEAAAETIGANGLLCRVGAYFHDIGKMLKPGYFVENQGADASRHEALVPTMSTLVIIAHVKDGADLARQYSLPQSLIDFIEQHHGTTLVEYFYSQARRDQREDEDSPSVDESNFRYPGPKPQTREAGVLMLADSVEGASRALVDPTPARIESLVHDMMMKRLLDGQFDECGLTLRELHLVEDSLVKSLTAVYHGRVKYPSQATA